MNEVFIVWREGIHMQGIFGVYSDIETATEKAIEFIKEECDDYHTFNITDAIIGENLTDSENYGHIDQIRKITRKDIRKKGTKIIIDSKIEVIEYE